ncbi:hypothetical protein MYCTH_2127673 [Thermothelomyces thermophilus ATCC 42464]|uniref:Uncharacterized protein n=1 Tax=Thermothelomyces thermophilus (strain ATCC 42464 / BCRC 31852 / DSM 1799) TaxID=573729 RepID=G2QGR2_THET4|nr:uncharacterized protein MYCTH_2127673 [Thermothelomyces thermophilus ATCC 42464]AEO58624.1 hypothetical protein MYCTH_2127673 [Thermothelomyces thermophilus ATCC 42464]
MGSAKFLGAKRHSRSLNGANGNCEAADIVCPSPVNHHPGSALIQVPLASEQYQEPILAGSTTGSGRE